MQSLSANPSSSTFRSPLNNLENPKNKAFYLEDLNRKLDLAETKFRLKNEEGYIQLSAMGKVDFNYKNFDGICTFFIESVDNGKRIKTHEVIIDLKPHKWLVKLVNLPATYKFKLNDVTRMIYVRYAMYYDFFGYLPKEIVFMGLNEEDLLLIKPFTDSSEADVNKFILSAWGNSVNSVLSDFGLAIEKAVIKTAEVTCGSTEIVLPYLGRLEGRTLNIATKLK